MRKITAVIPVRKGSVRVKNKNLKPFAGSTLLEIKIKQLKKVKGIENIVVTSDCEKMIAIAKSLGVSTHKRGEYYASSEASNSEFFKNIGESIDADFIMYSPVTCPLISLETYHECIDEFKTNKSIESLVTVSSIKHHLWHDGKPINYEIDKAPNSQDLPDIYAVTYGVCIISRENMIKYSNAVTLKPKFRVLDEIESIDIDTEFDFLVAEYIYQRIRKEGESNYEK
jgi:CMP-N-acetylneuraminic acid synthetase